MDALISAFHLSFTIAGKKILDDISLSLYGGQVTTLLGTNGAGKSSLLKILSGELQADKNSQTNIRYFSDIAQQWPREKLAQKMAILPQQSSLSFSFTVQEVVKLGLLPLNLSAKQGQKVVNNSLDKVGLLPLSERLYPSLSGGEKQRVHLARVLTQLSQAGDNALLMLDEPTAALDLAYQHKTLALAKSLAEQGYAVLVVLHDLNLAAQYSDRIIVLKAGKIEVDGSPWQALTSSMVTQTYGHQSLIKKHPVADYPVVYSL